MAQPKRLHSTAVASPPATSGASLVSVLPSNVPHDTEKCKSDTCYGNRGGGWAFSPPACLLALGRAAVGEGSRAKQLHCPECRQMWFLWHRLSERSQLRFPGGQVIPPSCQPGDEGFQLVPVDETQV